MCLPMPPTHRTLNIFFTLKSKFAAHRAPYIHIYVICIEIRKGGKRIDRNRFSECARFGGEQNIRIGVQCESLCTEYGRAKRLKKKNYNIFLELYPSRQLLLWFLFLDFPRVPECDHPRFFVMEKFPGCMQ